MDRKEIATRLLILRGKKSQQSIADEVGVSRAAWAMYERGARIPKDNVKVKIAKYFNTTVQKLFFD